MQPSGGVQDSIQGLKLGREEEVEALTGIYRLISREEAKFILLCQLS